jgi:ribosome-binding protein aMBF1 (putative translation factor)
LEIVDKSVLPRRRTSRLSPAFAKLIRKYRLQKGLSQEVLAEAASVHHTYIGLLERRFV